MRIGYLGAGAWGFCLAHLLALKGHEVILWAKDASIIDHLKKGGAHPKLKEYSIVKKLRPTANLSEAITDVDLVVESVTSQGIRPVLMQILKLGGLKAPFVLTSKGIEQNSGLLLSEVATEVLGAESKTKIGCLSGPSIAQEVMQKLPTSVVSSAYDPELMLLIREAFVTPYFRVYPNADMPGVSFGGAMKNIIAIASGVSDGLRYGQNSKAALMTRGLHEMRKLITTKGGKAETLNGLSGLGDLVVTCSSVHSRNYLFGKYIAEGLTSEEAKEKIGMVVEGAYSCVSALQLSKKYKIPVPITEAVHGVLYGGLDPKTAVEALLTREIKQEHL